MDVPDLARDLATGDVIYTGPVAEHDLTPEAE